MRGARLRLYHTFFLIKRPMTLGVRAAAFDEAGRVFLVRHTYIGGWHLPGGGVERGETAPDALAKELMEEGHLTMIEPPRLASVHFNQAASGWDHVLFFHCPLVVQARPRLPDREIAEAGFFTLDALPEKVTPATRRRLAELDGSEPSRYW